MKIVSTISEVRKEVAIARSRGDKVGFVPTMGALHEGHLSLIRQAADKTDFLIVSIFVNPTQFGPSEDFESYPRDVNTDASLSKPAGADLIFAPEVNEMYPVKNRSWVDVEGVIAESLCGGSRPGHFRGVTTVCSKLFNIVTPDLAFFGQKDAQQVAVIKAMVSDLNMPLGIEVCPIVREPSGLAMSSRNKYLSPEELETATLLNKSLQMCKKLAGEGENDSGKLISAMTELINTSDGTQIDYIEIVDFETLEPLEKVKSGSLVALAVKVGPARLIDNIVLDLNNM